MGSVHPDLYMDTSACIAAVLVTVGSSAGVSQFQDTTSQPTTVLRSWGWAYRRFLVFEGRARVQDGRAGAFTVRAMHIPGPLGIPSPFHSNRWCVRGLQALVAPKPPQGVLVRGHAGRVINDFTERDGAARKPEEAR